MEEISKKTLVPPPMVKRIDALEFTDPTIPGEIKIDKDGKLLKRWFTYEGTVGSLVDQYNNWITNVLPSQLASKTLTVPSGQVSFENLLLRKPMIKTTKGGSIPLYPNMARDSGYSYVADMYVDMVLNKGDPSEERIENSFLGKVPVMLGSALDWLSTKSEKEAVDLGEGIGENSGYFIIKGTEKIVLIQEKLRANRFFVFNSTSKGDVVIKITNNTLLGSTQITMARGKKSGALKIHLGFMKRNKGASNKLGNTISVFQIFRMLGVKEPTEMLAYVSLFTKADNRKKIFAALQPSFVKLMTKGDDIEYLSKKMGLGNIDYSIRKSDIMRDLKDQLFPQIPAENITQKLYMMSMMIVRLLECLLGFRDLDDRDNWGNKQLVTAGKSLELLFSSIWREAIIKSQNEIDSKNLAGLKSAQRSLDSSFVTDNFIESFTANNWGVQSSFMSKENITDILKRDSILSVFSHLTKINTPSSRKSKAPKVRMVQMSQLGYVDASETPEGDQCLAVGTPVLMADGTWKPIEEIKTEDIVTVNPTDFKQESSKIVNSFRFHTKDSGKKVYKLATNNGRSIEATGDHPFLTERGWVKLSELNKEDRICIKPYQNYMSNKIESNLIIDEEKFKSNLREAGVKESLILKYSNELTTMGFLPLKSDFKYLHLLARIAGFVVSDGHLGLSDGPIIDMTFGQNIDAENYLNDLEILGFAKTKISYKVSQIIDKNTERESIHHTYKVRSSPKLAALFIALGSTYGRKTTTPRKPIPEFVMKGSDLVKREYLSGFQGGDGNAMHGVKRKDKVKAYNFGFSDVSQQIEREHKDSLLYFMQQMADLFNYMGVETYNAQVRELPEYIDSKNVECYYRISRSEQNLIKYMDVIGYRYASTKNNKGIKVTEYLRYKTLIMNKRKELKDTAINMYKNGKTIKQISLDMNLPYRKASSIIEYWKVAGENTSSLPNPKDLISYDQFLFDNPIKEEQYIFLKIETIKQIEDIEVADFTTVSDNHSFIANGFVTHNCGLVKNSSITNYISLDRPEEPIIHAVTKYVSGSPTVSQPNPFMLNGVFMGWVNGSELRNFTTALRRGLKLAKDTAIVLDRDGVFNIYTDSSRPTRPLLLVDEDGQLIIKKKDLWDSDFETLLREGCAEYVDAWEQETIMLAQRMTDIEFRQREVEMALRAVKEAEEKLSGKNPVPRVSSTQSVESLETIYTPSEEETKNLRIMLTQAQATLKELSEVSRYTHSEMDPTAIMSLAISVIPLAETNPGPRLTYQAGMGKQSLGIYHSNHASRFDTSAKLLAYPSRPMFETQMNSILGLNELPAGDTVILAITTYGGFSQEDAIIMAKGAIDRGLFRSIIYKSYKSAAKKGEEFAKPEIEKGKEKRYESIDERGLPRLGSFIREGDCIIGKVRKNPVTGKKENASTYVELRQEGVVDRILVSTNQEGNRIVKVKIRQVRKPVLGDKFACYTPDHEVLTLNKGWIPISELNMNQKVLSLENGKPVFTEIKAIQQYDYDGKMYNIKSKKVELCVTPNHRMYVKKNEEFEFFTADEIFGNQVNYSNMDEEFEFDGKEEWINYKGKVHCCTVESGIIYVRRNGKSVWCGNSRYAQKGTIGMILPDEDMPFTASGIRPDIIINPHCFTRDTLISTYKGYSKRIDNFSSEGGEKVWAWDENNKSFVVSSSAGMESKGIRKIVKVYLEDGRSIKCTPDHRFLTVKNRKILNRNAKGEIFMVDNKLYSWVEAKDLGKTSKIVCGIEMPEDNSEDDNNSNWSLISADYIFDMKTPLNREKSLAFARILGYTITDGCVSKREDLKHGYVSTLNMGHDIDAQALQEDIFLITGKSPKYSLSKGTVNIRLPASLSGAIGKLEGVQSGKRCEQGQTLPSFLNSPDCPKSIIREFLGGLFGGDGIAPHISERKTKNEVPQLMQTGFIQTSQINFTNELKLKMENIVKLLEKLNVKVNRIDGPAKIQYNSTGYGAPLDGIERVSFVIQLGQDTSFAKNVGFRYCIQKTCRLAAAVSYWRYQEEIVRQHDWVVSRTNELYESGQARQRTNKKSISVAIDIARKELISREPVINEYYSLSNVTDVHNRRNKGGMSSKSLSRFLYDHMMDPKTFFFKANCLQWFRWENQQKNEYIVERGSMTVPSFELEVIDVRDAGEEEVFDIGVHNQHNFLANGIVVHNCMPSRMTIGKMIEIVTSKLAAFTGERANATSFRRFDVQEFMRNLTQYGYSSSGRERMYSGMTGKPLEAMIFTGPCYYQALRHQVSDKIQMRARGGITQLTHQPVGGLKRLGGQRVGEMERDAIVSHGASAFLRERLCLVSDAYETVYCVECGKIAITQNESFICRTCEDKAKFGRCTIPYSFKLLSQLLSGANFQISFKMKESSK